MNPETAQTPRSLTRAVLLLQLKLLLDTVRDLALSPLSLAAAALDLLLSGRQSPRYFQLILRLGKRSDDWIDLWSEFATINRRNARMLMRCWRASRMW